MDVIETLRIGAPSQRPTNDAQNAKRAAWDRLQAEAPDHADFIRAVSAAFGKPAMVSITINGERLL